MLGISPAATSLAQLTLREPVGRPSTSAPGAASRRCTWPTHADAVVATDINARAVWAAEFNAALNELPTSRSARVRSSTRCADETFDLITTNPPFVISPATGTRSSTATPGLPGDEVVEHIVRNGPAHLTDGGWLQVLANWAIHRDVPWDERLAAWVPDGCAALVVQREVLDPAAYVELWLKDAGLHGAPTTSTGTTRGSAGSTSRVSRAIGFGWINVHRSEHDSTYLDWPYAVEQPVAPAIRDWASAAAHPFTEHDRLTLRVDVVQETTGEPGAEDPEAIVLRQQRGLRRARQVDTVEAAVAGACDGELTVGQILDALATLTERDPGELGRRTCRWCASWSSRAS